ncbi:CinA family protein [Stagnimonas aquatica]|uniref:CinA family protein n=1 Tax=Stagnimonas aquatica TaxID=2689987 RepID=A0A3N0V7I8_9GAMM|nr:CinA family protein [Stagnimonas aquatica]ROH88767.1 CinA family protein [Stagnimonas aquatica]
MSGTGLVEQIAARLLVRGEWLATAESCTGGLIAKRCTDLAGSSAWFERGLVSYSNRAKQELLGVPLSVLDAHGAVSRETVLAMASGLLSKAPVQRAIAVSGIAGPGGGSVGKPVGLVWIAWASASGAEAREFNFPGDREAVREQAAEAALVGLLERL